MDRNPRVRESVCVLSCKPYKITSVELVERRRERERNKGEKAE